MIPHQFQSLMFSIGSRNHAVRIVKEFLNAHPRVRIFNLPLNQEFDALTQAALAEYQRYKQLQLTDGAMNAETWATIGTDMHPAKIDVVSTQNSAIRSLLTNRAGGGRGLSADEIKLAQSVYKTSINYNKVKVHKGKYIDLGFGIGQGDHVLMTPNGEIYAPPNVYSSDYAAYETDDFKATFIHEMCHVWQWQRNIKNVRTDAILNWIDHGGSYSEAYKYKLQKYLWMGTQDNDLVEYQIEQQAAILQDYYRVILRQMPFNRNSKGETLCQNTQPLNEVKDLLKWILRKFIANPGYLGSTP